MKMVKRHLKMTVTLPSFHSKRDSEKDSRNSAKVMLECWARNLTQSLAVPDKEHLEETKILMKMRMILRRKMTTRDPSLVRVAGLT